MYVLNTHVSHPHTQPMSGCNQASHVMSSLSCLQRLCELQDQAYHVSDGPVAVVSIHRRHLCVCIQSPNITHEQPHG